MPSRHRFLEPIHNVKDGADAPDRGEPRIRFSSSLEILLPLRRWRDSGGGASRDRTDDLKLAKLALSQLSYGPSGLAVCEHGGPSRS